MIKVAQDTYDTITEFTEPWTFWVIDNFLSDSFFKKLISVKEKENFYQLVDNGKTKQNSKYAIYLTKSDKATKHVKEVLHKLNIENVDSYSIGAELVKCEPGYAYHTHRDHPCKTYTIVVFIDPDEGNGTILVGSDKQEYEVVWKKNRALIIRQDPLAFHRYTNTTNQNRFSFNIFLMDGKHGFAVNANLKTRS